MLCYVMLCYALLCYAMLSYAMLYNQSPRVAKSMFSASTPALLSRLSRVLLPAFVYPTSATTGSPRRILEDIKGGGRE